MERMTSGGSGCSSFRSQRAGGLPGVYQIQAFWSSCPACDSAGAAQRSWTDALLGSERRLSSVGRLGSGPLGAVERIWKEVRRMRRVCLCVPVSAGGSASPAPDGSSANHPPSRRPMVQKTSELNLPEQIFIISSTQPKQILPDKHPRRSSNVNTSLQAREDGPKG